jgi:acyl-coenzyme A thioesterase PaaI-like protein
MAESGRNQWCFACGPLNPIGLKLKFLVEDDKYITKFTAGPEHQSYDGVVHGGIISTLLDEIMAGYPLTKGLEAVTGRLEIRYRQATPIGQELTATGWMTKKRGKFIELASTLTLPDGTITAEGKASVMVVREVKE